MHAPTNNRWYQVDVLTEFVTIQLHYPPEDRDGLLDKLEALYRQLGTIVKDDSFDFAHMERDLMLKYWVTVYTDYVECNLGLLWFDFDIYHKQFTVAMKAVFPDYEAIDS